MKSLKESLFDDDLVAKDSYLYHPKSKRELIDCIKKELDRQGPDADLNLIDVSGVDNMDTLFYGLGPKNIDISLWDVSNVINMNAMFFRCFDFNCDLSKWDVSNVINMDCMFYKCKKFNSDLSKWDVSKVRYMDRMFVGCVGLKKIPDWYRP